MNFDHQRLFDQPCAAGTEPNFSLCLVTAIIPATTIKNNPTIRIPLRIGQLSPSGAKKIKA